MKRGKLIQHLEQHGCQLLREGANHTIYVNPANGKQTIIARHREIADHIAQSICKQLGIVKVK